MLGLSGDDWTAIELSLRIASILRRAKTPVDSGAPPAVQFGPFLFDSERGELKRDGELVRLTEREREMLRILARKPGDTVSREDLSGPGAPGNANERTIDVQVNRLRRKVELDPANPLFLQTVRGLGYRLLVDR